MRIAVLSDTHMDDLDSDLMRVFEKQLHGMEAVLHLGDFTGERVWAYLNSHACFYGVRGNMDRGQWTAHLPGKRVVRVGGLKIGMVHGFGSGQPERLATEVFDPEPDLICFGHTHQPLWLFEPGKTPLLNPGSFCLPRSGQAGYAVLRVSNGRLAQEPEWVSVLS